MTCVSLYTPCQSVPRPHPALGSLRDVIELMRNSEQCPSCGIGGGGAEDPGFDVGFYGRWGQHDGVHKLMQVIELPSCVNANPSSRPTGTVQMRGERFAETITAQSPWPPAWSSPGTTLFERIGTIGTIASSTERPETHGNDPPHDVVEKTVTLRRALPEHGRGLQ